ncbi:MAG: tRNA (N(6)-L-threonylcarbamoyladenosine(37)-C(2))-methylthiotransferase MtaB [Spirochaetaceae bacterium]|nr:tRNA (N(6)-L-threonylcarbamoyladenosine(37)-C(2))-methylthiotransferase MtaB [Spirochaetaceae bacterium]
MYTVHFETLGCKLNQIETESAARIFASAGAAVTMGTAASREQPRKGEALSPGTPPGPAPRIFSPVPFNRLCIVNTCTVTGKAEQKARRLVRALTSRWPGAAVIVTGCYAELEPAQIRSLGDRVAVVPGSVKDALAELPARLEAAGAAGERFLPPEEFFSLIESWTMETAGVPSGDRASSQDRFALSADDFIRSDEIHHSRASVKIQDGCGNRCTYCRIRLARGAPVSLPVEETVERVRSIERNGWHEAVLTGVNLSQYRGRFSSDGETADLAGLLRILLTGTEHIALRLSSLYPECVDENLASVIADRRIRPHFHLSIQSGSDSILAAMNRPYRTAQVYEAVSRLRRVKENPFIACDIIVGFPGETEADFQQTLNLCRELAFAWIHVFPFSPRPGTAAFTMKPVVPQRIARERVGILTGIARANRAVYGEYWNGRILRAIVEGRDAASGKVCVLTENYLRLRVCGVPPELGRGSPVTLRVTGVSSEEGDPDSGDRADGTGEYIH